MEESFVDYFRTNGPQLSVNHFLDSVTTVSAVEIWKEKTNDCDAPEFTVEDVVIPSDSVTRWMLSMRLGTHADGPGQNGRRQLALRLVLIPILIDHAPHHLGIRRETFEEILNQMGLKELYHYGASGCITLSKFDGYVNEEPLPPLLGRCPRSQAFTVFIADYFGLWSRYDPALHATQGICMGTPTGSPKFVRHALAQFKFLITQPARFMPFVTAVALTCSLERRLESAMKSVAEVENRTGHYGWDVSRFGPAAGDFANLSARMSGLASTLAAIVRINRTTEQVLETLAHDGELKGPVTNNEEPEGGRSARELDQLLNLMRRRCQSQLTFIQYTSIRVQNQIQALFNLINQQDMKVSLSLARDSRLLASASKRDSSSMKTLAAVTVIFLPGTFVASVFSMSIFNWTERHGKDQMTVSWQGLWIYWVIAIPLTLLTILAWLLWTNRQRVLRRLQTRHDMDELDKELIDIENRLL